MNSLTKVISTGAAAGLVATIPMTLTMEFVRHRSSSKQLFRTPMPPREVAFKFARRTGIGKLSLTGKKAESYFWFSHLGYGAAMGALFEALEVRFFKNESGMRSSSTVGRGAVFGLAVWLLSYEAALPMVGIVAPTHRRSRAWNLTLFASHLAWGASLGWISARARQARQNRKSTLIFGHMPSARNQNEERATVKSL